MSMYLRDNRHVRVTSSHKCNTNLTASITANILQCGKSLTFVRHSCKFVGTIFVPVHTVRSTYPRKYHSMELGVIVKLTGTCCPI